MGDPLAARAQACIDELSVLVACGNKTIERLIEERDAARKALLVMAPDNQGHCHWCAGTWVGQEFVHQDGCAFAAGLGFDNVEKKA